MRKQDEPKTRAYPVNITILRALLDILDFKHPRDGVLNQHVMDPCIVAFFWLLRPADDPNQPWKVDLIDKNSGGFEHASILADLDGDGKDELYVASDKNKAVRRYTWNGARMSPETIYTRPRGEGGVFTWNIMPIPVELVPDAE